MPEYRAQKSSGVDRSNPKRSAQTRCFQNRGKSVREIHASPQLHERSDASNLAFLGSRLPAGARAGNASALEGPLAQSVEQLTFNQ